MMALQILYLAFPLILGGLLQGLVIRYRILTSLAWPLDLGHTFRGKRIFGDNKTFRGLVVMVAGSTLGMSAQGALFRYEIFRRLSLFDYSGIDLTTAGAVLGLGFILAELPNSFIKRRCDIAPGNRGTGLLFWLFAMTDQLDSIVGCLIAAAVTFWIPPWPVVLGSLILGILLHMAVNGVFVLIKVKARVF